MTAWVVRALLVMAFVPGPSRASLELIPTPTPTPVSVEAPYIRREIPTIAFPDSGSCTLGSNRSGGGWVLLLVAPLLGWRAQQRVRCERLARVGWRKSSWVPALALLLGAAGCGGGGGDGAPSAPRADSLPSGEQAIERSSAAAVGVVLSLAAVVSGVPGTGVGGGAAAVELTDRDGRVPLDAAIAALADAAEDDFGNGGAAARVPCSDGGSVDASCRLAGGSYTLGGSFANCRMVNEFSGEVLTLNGGLAVTAADPDICGGEVPDNVGITLRLTNYSVTIAGADGSLALRVTANLTQVIDPSGVAGCAGPSFVQSMNGSLAVSVPENGVDVSVNAQNLVLTVASGGVPCTQHITANGSIDTLDRTTGQRFAQSLHDFRISLIDVPGGSLEATLDGRLTVSCIGSVTFETIAPVRVPAGAPCPASGVLSVRRDDGASGRIRFTAQGGVEIDYGADGTVDVHASDCRDASLSQCG